MSQPFLPTQILTLAVGFSPNLKLRAIACIRYEPGISKSDAQPLVAIAAGTKGTGSAFSAFAYFLVALRIKQLAGDLSDSTVISGSTNSPASSLYNSFQKNSAWRNRLFGSASTERRFRDNSLRFEKPTPKAPEFCVYWNKDNPIRIRIFKSPNEIQQITNRSLDDELETRFLVEALTNLVAMVQQTPHRFNRSAYIWQSHSITEKIVRLFSTIQNRESYPSLKINVNRKKGAPREFTIHSSNYPIPHLQETDELSIALKHTIKAYYCIFWISWDGQSTLELSKIFPYPNEDFPPNPQQGLFEIEFDFLSDVAGSSVKIPIGPGFPIEFPSGLESCLVFSSLEPFDNHIIADLRRRIATTLQSQPPTRRSLTGAYSEKGKHQHPASVDEALVLMPRVGHPQIYTPWTDLFSEKLDLADLGIESMQMMSMQVKPL